MIITFWVFISVRAFFSFFSRVALDFIRRFSYLAMFSVFRGFVESFFSMGLVVVFVFYMFTFRISVFFRV